MLYDDVIAAGSSRNSVNKKRQGKSLRNVDYNSLELKQTIHSAIALQGAYTIEIEIYFIRSITW